MSRRRRPLISRKNLRYGNLYVYFVVVIIYTAILCKTEFTVQTHVYNQEGDCLKAEAADRLNESWYSSVIC